MDHSFKANIALMNSLRKTQTGANVGDAAVDDGFAEKAVKTLLPGQGPARLQAAELTVEDITSRASKTGALLEGILRASGGPPPRDWGLNE